MLSHRLWQRRFAGDPALVGRTIQIDGVAHEVVGILPRDFALQLPAEAFQVTDGDLWAPIQFDYGQPLPRNLTFFTVFGRLAPGVTFEQAQAEMDLIAAQFRSEFPEHEASKLRHPRGAAALRRGEARPPGAVRSCSARWAWCCSSPAPTSPICCWCGGPRAAAEFALRTALGASRWAMVRQVLTESLLLARRRRRARPGHHRGRAGGPAPAPPGEPAAPGRRRAGRDGARLHRGDLRGDRGALRAGAGAARGGHRSPGAPQGRRARRQRRRPAAGAAICSSSPRWPSRSSSWWAPGS